jgi:hypothetical protein
MLRNTHYLGDAFYPTIIKKELLAHCIMNLHRQ